jgi:nucleotide-binding universal stress UspA family protein
MVSSILVPLDGSRFGEHALPYALTITRRTGARVEVVCVHVPPPPLPSDTLLPPEDALDAEFRMQELDYLDGVVPKLSAAGMQATSSLLDGRTVVEALAEHAAVSGADLVVMTTHGRGPLSRFWLGSVADALMRRLTAPLLLIRPREDDAPSLAAALPLRRVLVPLDGSEEAEAVLQPAADLAGADAEYTLFRVVDPLPVVGLDAPLYSPRGDGPPSRRLQIAAEEARAYLDGPARRLRGRGARVETRTAVDPSPGAAILYGAAAAKCDLIALATHGRGGLARLLLGSVADKVVRGAAVPVLVHRTAAQPPLK